MKKKEKYSSFEEMKENSTSIKSANAAVVMKRHEKLEGFINFFRNAVVKTPSTKSIKSASKE